MCVARVSRVARRRKATFGANCNTGRPPATKRRRNSDFDANCNITRLPATFFAAGGRVAAAITYKDAAPAPNSRRSGSSRREGRCASRRRATPRPAPAGSLPRCACARFFSAGSPCADRSATGQGRCSRPDRSGRSSCPRGSGRCGTLVRERAVSPALLCPRSPRPLRSCECG